MSRFYQIAIIGTDGGGAHTYYLTSNGLVGGRACKTHIPEAADLLTPHSGNTTVAADGTPFTEKPLTAGKGRAFQIQIDWLPTAVYSNLKTLIDYCVEHDTALRVTASGEPGSIDVDVSPNFAPVPIDPAGFTDSYIKGLTLRFITVEVN